jgi:hypothetical protein
VNHHPSSGPIPPKTAKQPEFAAGALITKYLRNFGPKIGAVSIYYPAVVQSEMELLIINGLQLLVLPKRQF